MTVEETDITELGKCTTDRRLDTGEGGQMFRQCCLLQIQIVYTHKLRRRTGQKGKKTEDNATIRLLLTVYTLSKTFVHRVLCPVSVHFPLVLFSVTRHTNK